MRKLSDFAIFTMLSLVLGLASCSPPKDEVDPDKDNYSKPNDRTATAEVDEALDQVNDMISNNIGGGSNMKLAAGAAYDLPCGVVSVDSSTTSGGKTVYKMNYGDKTQCGYKYKSGLISFALTNTSTGFNVAGAVFTITFTDYVVEVNATGSYVKLNGTISVTNVNGSYVWEVINNPSLTVTHTIRGTLNITYHDNKTRERKYFQRREWSSASGWSGLTLSIDADSIDGTDKISEVGSTYEFDLPFKTIVSTPFVWSNCGTTWAGPYKLKQGAAKLDVNASSLGISPSYIDVEAGYYWNYSSTGSTPTLDNTCQSNAYKITTVFGATTIVTHQLY